MYISLPPPLPLHIHSPSCPSLPLLPSPADPPAGGESGQGLLVQPARSSRQSSLAANPLEPRAAPRQAGLEPIHVVMKGAEAENENDD